MLKKERVSAVTPTNCRRVNKEKTSSTFGFFLFFFSFLSFTCSHTSFFVHSSLLLISQALQSLFPRLPDSGRGTALFDRATGAPEGDKLRLDTFPFLGSGE